MTAPGDPARRLEERRLEQEGRDQYAVGAPSTDDTVNLPAWVVDELFAAACQLATTDAERERWGEIERRYHR